MEVLLLLVRPASIVVFFVVTGWMLKSYFGHRERMKGLALSAGHQETSDQRLARVEQAVESIAIEVERISEGQRFVTKLLSEARPARDLAVPASAVNTPH